MKKLASTVLAAVLILGVSGCANVRKRTTRQKVYPNIFKNDLSLLLTNFTLIKKGQTTKEDLKKMGFDLRARNLKIIEGAPAFRELFGQEAFRNVDPQKFEVLLPELNLYTLYQVPFKDVTTVADRLYVSSQKITVSGPDVMCTIIVRDGTVVYAAKQELYNKTEEYRKRFLGGIIDVLGEFGQAIGSAARFAQ